MVEQTDLPVVVIIDREGERRRAMSLAFEGIASVQVAYNREADLELILQTASGQNLDEIGPALVALCHFRDQNVEPELKPVATVFYGGNGGDDPECPADVQERIWRPINGTTGVLTSEEARELLRYADGLQSNLQNATRPDFLEKPSSFPLLSALVILCQGYLAVHAYKEGNEWKPDEIVNALEKMGWTVFMDEKRPQLGHELVRRDLATKRDDVSKTCWWLEDFGLWDKGALADEEKRNAFIEDVKTEWSGPLPEVVQTLLDALLAGTEVKPLIVAEAFCAIVDKLENV